MASFFWSMFPAASLDAQFLLFIRQNASIISSASRQDEEEDSLPPHASSCPDKSEGIPDEKKREKENDGLGLAEKKKKNKATSLFDYVTIDVDAADRLVCALFLSNSENSQNLAHNGALQVRTHGPCFPFFFFSFSLMVRALCG